MNRFQNAFIVLFLIFALVDGASKLKPHPHKGVLTPYDGKHMAYSIDADQLAKLNAGQPVVIIRKGEGQSGRGIVIQDVQAPPSICMSKITDLPNYHKMVPKVKSIEIYSQEIENGDSITGATFNTAVFFVPFTFYLNLRSVPRYNTYSWTLDYNYSSDFDDNVGFWQVMPHPTMAGWTRILYSTEVKVPSWVPKPVCNFLTNTALVDSTTWVKKESEKAAVEAKKSGIYPPDLSGLPDISACFVEDADGAHYETYCSEALPESSSASFLDVDSVIDIVSNNDSIEDGSTDAEAESESDTISTFVEGEL